MVHTVEALAEPKCDLGKLRDKDYKLVDGKGIYLLVKPSEVKLGG
jgi:hypothetical protein